MIALIVVIIVIVIVFNKALFKGAKKEIMTEKGVDTFKEVTGEIEKTDLNELDASAYILYSIANWTPLVDLEDIKYIEIKNSLPWSFISEYFDVNSDNYHNKIKHITDKFIAIDEYDLITKRTNIVKSSKFLKEKGFQFKRDLVGVCALIINRRPFETLTEGPAKGELEVFKEMAKILGIKTEYVKDVGFIQVEGEFKD